MEKKIILSIALVVALLIVGGIFVFQKKSGENQVTSLNEIEKKLGEDMNLSEEKADVPNYSGAVKDEDKCGEDAFFVSEKSADFVKNYCKFLRENGWKLVHQDYPDCEDIKSFGGGYNYDKGQEKIAISVIKYGEDGTCYWVNKRTQ